MRLFLSVLLISGMAWGQAVGTAEPASPAAASTAPTNPTGQAKESNADPAATTSADPQDPNAAVIPAGTKIPLSLKQAISTKNAARATPCMQKPRFPSW